MADGRNAAGVLGPGKEGDMSANRYSLRISDAEHIRYRLMAEKARQDEAELWRLAGIKPGAEIVDVGCGPGATLVAMADVVGPDGLVVGIDSDPEAIERAKEMIQNARLTNASAKTGSADQTGLCAASFDTAVIRHMLSHNGGREQSIVDHVTTLLRPGGCLYLVDTEATAIRHWPPIPALAAMNERYVAFHTAQGNDLQIGLRLAALLSDAGLETVTHRGWFSCITPPVGMRPPVWAAREAMVAAGFVSPDELVEWERSLEQVDAAVHRPTYFVSTFGAIGRRR
jgi:ubiquinone/menaquinone biosynthesis C-methylase UbiE